MNKTKDIAIRDALLDFCKTLRWTNPQAVTLTLRLARLVGPSWAPLTRLDAQQNLRHFLNVLHKKLGSRGLPKQAQLHCVPIFEGHDTVRPHLHLMLDRPNCIDAAEYAALIRHEWARTFWGHREVSVEPCHDDSGWLGYISKLRTKKEYADAIDWTNFR